MCLKIRCPWWIPMDYNQPIIPNWHGHVCIAYTFSNSHRKTITGRTSTSFLSEGIGNRGYAIHLHLSSFKTVLFIGLSYAFISQNIWLYIYGYIQLCHFSFPMKYPWHLHCFYPTISFHSLKISQTSLGHLQINYDKLPSKWQLLNYFFQMPSSHNWLNIHTQMLHGAGIFTYISLGHFLGGFYVGKSSSTMEPSGDIHLEEIIPFKDDRWYPSHLTKN